VELLAAADVTVACQAISGRELLDYLEQGDRPDAVLLDIQMEGRRDDGVTTAEEIFERWPAQGVLLLSNHENDDLIRRFFAGGTARRGHLLKENFNDIEDVRHALDLVRRGKTFSDTAILDRFHRRQLTIRELLTPGNRKYCNWWRRLSPTQPLRPACGSRKRRARTPPRAFTTSWDDPRTGTRGSMPPSAGCRSARHPAIDGGIGSVKAPGGRPSGRRPATSRAPRRDCFLAWRTNAPVRAQGCATA
jgi:CheY-like chemotaxis protein